MEHVLTPLQAKLLDELRWFDGFCREHNLRYYAIGGTILGAMRHEGFIPWDDDIDLGMPRADYEKLKAYEGVVFGHYTIETYSSEKKDYCYPASKVFDTNTTLVEHKRTNVARGVFIDIFPLDGVGDDLKKATQNYRKIARLYQYFLTVVAAVRKGRSFKKNLAVILCHCIPSFIQNQRDIRIKLNKLCSEFDFDKSRYGGNLLGAYFDREIIPLELFGTPQEYQFEDFRIFGPQYADEYLKRIYKDWRKLPPKEKQVSHHDFVELDLNKPFMTV